MKTLVNGAWSPINQPVRRIEIHSFFFSQVMSALKTGAIANNRFAVIIERHHKHLTEEIPVDRSGGGL